MNGDVRVTHEQVLAWRLRRQGLVPRTDASAEEIVGRLAGVQAQVASAAELAVAVRQEKPSVAGVREALEARSLVRTWAMRGTLHLLPAGGAGAYLSLLGAARTWEKGAWQRAFGVSPRQMAALGEAVEEILDGQVLTRRELTEAVLARPGLAGLGEQLASGWSTVLKPLAWTGRLCQGPARGQHVTFASPRSWLPGWRGIPAPEEAAEAVIPAYLRAHGPATPEVFDAWLLRGATRKAVLRGWFEALGDRVAEVEVDGRRAYLMSDDADGLARTEPHHGLRLLPAFDQYVLAPGTSDARLVPPAHRSKVSRAAGWISPVVLLGGRVVGTWSLTGPTVELTTFEGSTLPGAELEEEVARLGACLGQELEVVVGGG
ncbi:winged helix DNA-binding domain-containing protein [Streptomyces albofaciens JCM 4342]|uniref:winged helix DNA-binding domain-containing protein n=1 Tax=Streptomyces albofaciens TaxID=66866 RepID=UPI0012385B4E|nr:winged helix DNA-binding domain-containing protein [Streptomyces albofaciens]KAA6214805.1 winged helix DNA-binding domain-containing protein [Streptomyces albofaciens JCM 4342]